MKYDFRERKPSSRYTGKESLHRPGSIITARNKRVRLRYCDLVRVREEFRMHTYIFYKWGPRDAHTRAHFTHILGLPTTAED